MLGGMARSIKVHTLVLAVLFAFIMGGTTCAKQSGWSAVAYTTSQSYGWPVHWLTLIVEDTALRAFYEMKPDPSPQDRKRIRHYKVDWRAFSAAASLSALIAVIVWLPFFVWCRRKGASNSEIKAA